ncbi:MAG TPA: hypothetical protein IAB65_03360 [Candidatus Onthocola stercorigallinarum]|jgi:hypothetical protein|nr:hypothetical protein [Candidatus Onthocola stercorigallinarum]
MIKHTKNIVVNDCSDIPLEIIEDIKIINFIVVIENIKTIEKKLEMINNLHKKYSNKIFNVIISRKCENLPRL